LDPYTFSWQLFNAQNFSIPVPFSPQYSNNNRTLRVFVDDATRSNEYRCMLQLRRCDINRASGVPRCQAMSYFGPRTGFEVFGKQLYSICWSHYVACFVPI
jgi:hypothetical protein